MFVSIVVQLSFLLILSWNNKIFFFLYLRIPWRLFMIFKTAEKCNVLWYVKLCIFWKCIQYTIHRDNMPLFFFRERQIIIVLLSIVILIWAKSTRFVSLKLCVGFSIFDSVSFLLKFIFLFDKMHWLFDFLTS